MLRQEAAQSLPAPDRGGQRAAKSGAVCCAAQAVRQTIPRTEIAHSSPARPHCLLRMLLFFPSPTGSNSLLKQFWRLLRNPPVNSKFPYPVFLELNFYTEVRTTARPEIGVRRLELLVARPLQSNPTEKDLAKGGASRSRKSRPVISTLPSALHCRRRNFRSAISSSRVR